MDYQNNKVIETSERRTNWGNWRQRANSSYQYNRLRMGYISYKWRYAWLDERKYLRAYFYSRLFLYDQSPYSGLWVEVLTPKSYSQTFIRPLYGFGFSDYCYKNNIRNCFIAIWITHRFFVTLCIKRWKNEWKLQSFLLFQAVSRWRCLLKISWKTQMGQYSRLSALRQRTKGLPLQKRQDF